MHHRGALKGNHDLPSPNCLIMSAWAATKNVCKILPTGADLSLHNPVATSFAANDLYSRWGRILRTKQLHKNTNTFIVCTNTCSHGDARFMAIPGIFKHASLLLREEAGDWLRKGESFCDQCETAAKAGLYTLACTDTHRPTPHAVFTVSCTFTIMSSLKEPCLYRFLCLFSIQITTTDYCVCTFVCAFNRLIWSALWQQGYI